MQHATEHKIATKLASALYDFEEVPLKDRARILQRMIGVEASIDDTSSSTVPILAGMLTEVMYRLAHERYPNELPSVLRKTAEQATATMLSNSSCAAV